MIKKTLIIGLLVAFVLISGCVKEKTVEKTVLTGCSIEESRLIDYTLPDWELIVAIPSDWDIHELGGDTNPGMQALAPEPMADIDFLHSISIYLYTEDNPQFPSIKEYISRKTLPVPGHTYGEVFNIEVNGYKGKMFDSTRPYPDAPELPEIEGLIKSRKVVLQGTDGFYVFSYFAPEEEFESSCGVLGQALYSIHSVVILEDLYVKGDVVVGFEKNISQEEAEAILSQYNLVYTKTIDVNLGKIFFYETGEKFIIKVPEGKENYWIDILNKEEGVYGASQHPDPRKILVD